MIANTFTYLLHAHFSFSFPFYHDLKWDFVIGLTKFVGLQFTQLRLNEINVVELPVYMVWPGGLGACHPRQPESGQGGYIVHFWQDYLCYIGRVC